MQPQAQHLERGDTAARDRLLDLTGRVTRLLADHPELRERLPGRFSLTVVPYADAEVLEYTRWVRAASPSKRRWPQVFALIGEGVVEFWTGRRLERVAGYRLDAPADGEREAPMPPLEVGPFLERFKRAS